MDLLLACARTTLSKQTIERIRALAQQIIEWPYILRAAQEHGIRPILYHNFNAVCADIIPGPILESLRRYMISNAARNLVMSSELLRLLDGFKDKGIPAVPFKGPFWGAWAYNDLALRESSDLDIVIQMKDLSAAKAFLTIQGYHPRSGTRGEPIDTAPNGQGRYHVFAREAPSAIVDLQVALEAPHFSFALDDRELWGRAMTRRFAEKSVLSFRGEDLLILLCVHGTKDLWFRIKWICDIAQFIDGHEINWNHVLREATRLRARRKLLLGCFLSYDLLDSKVPEEILLRISRDPVIKVCAEAIVQRLSLEHRTFTDFERAALYFKTDDAVKDKAKRCLRYVFLYLRLLVVPTDDDRRFLKLPNWLSSAYCLVRPIRIIAKYRANPIAARKVLRRWFDHLG
jgi:hypothetical protein